MGEGPQVHTLTTTADGPLAVGNGADVGTAGEAVAGGTLQRVRLEHACFRLALVPGSVNGPVGAAEMRVDASSVSTLLGLLEA